MKIHNNFSQWDEQWHQIRKSKITWTTLKWVVWGPKAQNTAIYTLLAEKYLEEEELYANQILERGNLLEKVALDRYRKETWFIVDEVWFIEKDEFMWISPDWIIATHDFKKDELVYTRAVEIKCPRWTNYIRYLIENKIPDDYLYQVCHYFIIMDDLETLDFVIFNNEVIDGLKDFHIITVTRQDLQEYIDKANTKLEWFKEGWDTLRNILLTK